MLWGPPRSLSTSVERAMVENKDIEVVHEPFGVPHYWGSEAASSRNAEDRRVAATFASVAQRLWHDPLKSGKKYLFSKNLTYYFAPHCIPSMHAMLHGDYSKVVHSFIIRHPAKAIVSLYYKSCIDNEKTGYTHFDPAEAGYTSMRDILDHVEEQKGCLPVIIIDADDLLEDPEGLMAEYCAAVGLPFKPSMLSWTPGPCEELKSPWTGWTDDVLASSGITKRAKRSLPPSIEELPQNVRDTIAEAMPIYERMFARRLRPRGASPDGVVVPASPPATTAPLVGSLLIFSSVLIWVVYAEMLQNIASDEWNKPYTQAIVLKSSWVFLLPLWYVLHTCQESVQTEITFRRPLKPTLKTLQLGLLMMVLTQAASATWIASLSLTSVSINTAIYNVNPLLVYVFSIPLLKQPLTLTSMLAVIGAMVATSIVANGTRYDSSSPTGGERGIQGVVTVLASAIIYSFKEVIFKKVFPSVSVSLTPFTDSLLVVAIIGFASVVTMGPMIALLHYSGFEPFEVPPMELAKSYGLVALLMAAYQTCLLAAIALTTPTFVAVGAMLSVPASITYDFFARGYVVPVLSRWGIVGIILSFGLLVIASRVDALCSQCCGCVTRAAATRPAASAAAANGSKSANGKHHDSEAKVLV